MRIRLIRIWEDVRGSLWFVPSLMAVAGLGLAAVVLYLDAQGVADRAGGILPHVEAVGPEGARAILSTIAASAITVTGLVFSITIVVLNMASAQFGPRLIRTFMSRDESKVVIGAFLAIFIYSLVVLAYIRSGEDGSYAPQVATLLGLAIGIIGFGVLIFFIHHVAMSIQAAAIIDEVAAALTENLDKIFPEQPEKAAIPQDVVAPDWEQAATLSLYRSGYIQAVDYDALLRLCVKHDCRLRMLRRPGHYVIQGTELFDLLPANKRNDDALCKALRRAVVLGPERTATQDPEYSLHQLAEVAIRALSPGINDPFTAVNCVDRLAGALAGLAGRVPGPPVLCAEDGAPRVFVNPFTLEGLVAAALTQVRQAADGNAAVTLRLLEAMEALGELPLAPDMRKALLQQLGAIEERRDAQDWTTLDRAALEARLRAAERTLTVPPAPSTQEFISEIS